MCCFILSQRGFNVLSTGITPVGRILLPAWPGGAVAGAGKGLGVGQWMLD